MTAREGEADGRSGKGLRHLPDGGAEAGRRYAHRHLAARLLRDPHRIRFEHPFGPSPRRGNVTYGHGADPDATRGVRSRAVGAPVRSGEITAEPLSAVDTAWLHMEDPTNLMMVTGVLVFEEALDF